MRVISGSARSVRLSSIDDLSTRPTLDRVKESLFNIIQNRINEEAQILDLFAGSGAIGIEFISRGGKCGYFCDKSHACVEKIKQNLEKVKFLNKSTIIEKDYKKCLNDLSKKDIQFDIIYLDPPYKANLVIEATKEILRLNLLKEDGIIIIETDESERELKEISKLRLNICDLRKYGRVSLIFLNRKE